MADLIRENVMIAAPPGCKQVHLGGGSTGAEANELAITAALKTYAAKNGVDVSSLNVLGFENALHGTTTATLSCSSAEANPHGLPAFPWPKADFPQLKYPLAEYEHENKAEEDRCLAQIKGILSEGSTGAVIIEPMSGLAQQMATPYFYRSLRRMAKEHGVPFICDETKTGLGASGKNWAHEYWYMGEDQAPDYVTFGGAKYSGLSGFYSTLDQRIEGCAQAYSADVNMASLVNYGLTWNVMQQ